MKTTAALHRLAFAVLAVATSLSVGASRARAMFIFDVAQVGSNVTLTGSGTIDLADLTLGNSGFNAAGVDPAFGQLAAGPTSATSCSEYTGLTGPANFGGKGGYEYANTGSGNIVLVDGYQTNPYVPSLYVPSGYASGSPLTDSATWNNTTLSGLGLTSGVYTFAWGSGVNADSFVVLIGVPEPSTWALLAFGAGLLGLKFVRRRRIA